MLEKKTIDQPNIGNIKKVESFKKAAPVLEEIIEKVPENQSRLAASKNVKKPNTKSFHADKEEKEKKTDLKPKDQKPPAESPLKKPTSKITVMKPDPEPIKKA